MKTITLTHKAFGGHCVISTQSLPFPDHNWVAKETHQSVGFVTVAAWLGNAKRRDLLSNERQNCCVDWSCYGEIVKQSDNILTMMLSVELVRKQTSG